MKGTVSRRKSHLRKNIHNKSRKKSNHKIVVKEENEQEAFNTFKGSLLERNKFKNNENVEKVWKRYRQYVKELKDILKSTHLMNKNDVKNDFYTYINVDWLGKGEDKIEEKKFYVQIDDFRIAQENVYYELIGYVKDYIKENPRSSKAKAISNIYDSFYSASKKMGLEHAQTVKGMIEKHIERDDLYSLLAHINKDEVISWQCPIVWSVIPDEKNVNKYISHLDMPQLGIYDYMIYVEEPTDSIDTKKFKQEFKEKYLQFIRDTFKIILPDEYRKYNPIDVWNVEVELLDAMGCNKFKNVENEDYYNVVTKNDLETKYGFDWTDFTTKLGYKTPPEKIIVSSINGISCITQLLKKKWKTHEWKTYWLFIYYKQFLRCQWEWYETYFNFYEKYVQGKPVRFPREIYPIFLLSLTFNTFLTEQYVSHNLKPQAITYVTNMVNDFRQIFINKISRNTWLSRTTKKSALKKLQKLKAIIGYPEKMREDPILNYCNDDPWLNTKILTDWKHQQTIILEGMDVGVDIPTIDWNEFKLTGTQAYVVNAYYTPTSNSIYIPLAYLQKPFLDLDERGIEYNLAYVGQTITHELSHCLDDMGSRFDENGNLHDWWTKRDRKRFNAKIKDVVRQYTEFSKRDGINFDASIGVGENLADISGLSLAEEYLLLFQQANEDIDIIKKISLEAFYVYCAIQSRQKIYSKAIPAQLKTNPHPLEKYRCNCPLTRLEIFREIYDIKKGDKMWWHNTDTIW